MHTKAVAVAVAAWSDVQSVTVVNALSGAAREKPCIQATSQVTDMFSLAPCERKRTKYRQAEHSSDDQPCPASKSAKEGGKPMCTEHGQDDSSLSNPDNSQKLHKYAFSVQVP